MNIKFQVSYLKPRKKGYSKQTAILYRVEDAHYWADIVKAQGCKDIEVLPVPIL